MLRTSVRLVIIMTGENNIVGSVGEIYKGMSSQQVKSGKSGEVGEHS